MMNKLLTYLLSYTDLRKQDFLSEEKISDCSRFVNKNVSQNITFEPIRKEHLDNVKFVLQ